MRKIKFYNPDGKEIKWPHFLMWFCITSILFAGIIACYGVYEAYAEPLRVYLENKQAVGFRVRPADGIIQNHSGDTISYVEVSAGVTYYSERNLAYYSASLPKGNQPISIVVFPYTPSADGVIVVDDAVDGTLTDLKVYWLDDSGSGDDPDNPGTDDPDNPGTDDPDNPGTDDPDNPGTDDPVNPPYPSSEHSLDDIYEIMAATNDITVYETEAEFMAAEHNLSFYQTLVLRYLKELVTAVCCVCGLLLIILFTGRRKKD